MDAKNLDAKILTTEKDHVKINSAENDDIKFLKIDLAIMFFVRIFHYKR